MASEVAVTCTTSVFDKLYVPSAIAVTCSVRVENHCDGVHWIVDGEKDRRLGSSAVKLSVTFGSRLPIGEMIGLFNVNVTLYDWPSVTLVDAGAGFTFAANATPVCRASPPPS